MSKGNKIYSRVEKFFVLAKKSFFIAWYRHHLLIPPRSLYKYTKSFFANVKRGNGMSNMYTNQKVYQKWYMTNMKELLPEELKIFKYMPKFSFVVPCYNTSSKLLGECLDSLLAQSYKNFEIVVCNDASTNKETISCLESFKDKIIIVNHKENKNISEATNSAIKKTTGDYICFVDDDDIVHKDALYYICEMLNKYKNLDFIYTDEDKIDFNGKIMEPYFKPDYAPDNFLVNNYFNHLTCVKKAVLDDIGYMRSKFNGAQDYDLYLRVIEKTNNIGHVDKILYHWRKTPNSTADIMSNKTYSIDAGKNAIEDYLKRNGIKGAVFNNGKINSYLVKYGHKNPKVSIIIPMRDGAEVTKRCIDSLYNINTYKNFEIIIANNRSKENSTFEYFDFLKNNKTNIKIVDIDEDFNYSRINNLAITHATGDFILLLNNDTEVKSPDFIDWMLGYASQPHVGCVGMKLLYPNNYIQHAGVVLGYGGLAGHIYVSQNADQVGLFGHLVTPVNFSAVTAACLMIDREKFFGFDENLAVALNDVDLCLNVLYSGFYNVSLNNIEMMHYESKSRGYDASKEKHERYLSEQKYLKDKWGSKLDKDSFFSKYYF